MIHKRNDNFKKKSSGKYPGKWKDASIKSSGKKDDVKPRRKLKQGVSPADRFGYKLPDWMLNQQAETPPISSSTVKDLLARFDFPQDDLVVSQYVDHLLLVAEFNKEINLVSRTSVDNVLLHSLWESIIPAKVFDWSGIKSVMDIGTGGGFPGTPLAISLPETEFTLLDSRRAKTLALRSIVSEIKLENVEVIHERAEIFHEHDDRKFDLVTMKAVGLVKEAIPWVESLLKPGGYFLVWKGPEGLREFKSVDNSKWKIEKTIPIFPHRSVLVLKQLV